MKKALFTLVLIVSSLSLVTAQTEKGRWQIGVSVGSLSYQDLNNSGSKTFSGNILPSAGYFVANNLLIGTGISLSLSTTKSDNLITKSTTTGVGLSPFVRYYFGKSMLKPYVGASYSYTYNNYSYKTAFGNPSGTGYSSIVVPGVGIAYFINRNVALNAGLNYTIQTSKAAYLSFTSSVPSIVDYKTDFKALGLGLGFQLFFGK